MFQFIFLIPILAQDPKIYFQSFTSQDFTTSEGWIIQNYYNNFISDCGGAHLIGGFDTFGANTIAKTTIELPPHTHVEISFNVFLIDSWDSEYLYVYLDQQLFQFGPYQTALNQGDICGASYWSDSQYKISFIAPHSSQQIEIQITSNLDYLPFDESWGFRDFQLFLCNYCVDDNIVPFDGCFNNQYSCVIGCLNCIYGICLFCDTGWEFSIYDNTCVQIKNDGLLVIVEECDEIINFNRCQNGKFNCPLYCLLCAFGFCQKCDKFYYLIENKCLQEPLYYLDNPIQIIFPQQFKIIQSNGWFEISDDHYIFQQLKRQEYNFFQELTCDYGCVKCNFGICQLCENGWDLVKFQCIQKCRSESNISINQCSSQEIIGEVDLQKCKNNLIQSYPQLIIGKGLYLKNNQCEQFCVDKQYG